MVNCDTGECLFKFADPTVLRRHPSNGAASLGGLGGLRIWLEMTYGLGGTSLAERRRAWRTGKHHALRLSAQGRATPKRLP